MNHVVRSLSVLLRHLPRADPAALYSSPEANPFYARKKKSTDLAETRRNPIESKCCLPPHSGRWFRLRWRRRRRRTSPPAHLPRWGGVCRRRWWCARCGTTTPSRSGSPSAPAAASSTSSSGRTSPSSSAPRTRSQVCRRSAAALPSPRCSLIYFLNIFFMRVICGVLPRFF